MFQTGHGTIRLEPVVAGHQCPSVEGGVLLLVRGVVPRCWDVDSAAGYGTPEEDRVVWENQEVLLWVEDRIAKANQVLHWLTEFVVEDHVAKARRELRWVPVVLTGYYCLDDTLHHEPIPVEDRAAKAKEVLSGVPVVLTGYCLDNAQQHHEPIPVG